MTATASPNEDELLARLHTELERAPGKVREIEVGIALSIALGRRRLAVACGGCQTPLEFEGVPARTVAALREPFHLVLDAPERGA